MADFEELTRLPFIIDQLEAIQELHKPRFIGTETDGTPIYACLMCVGTKPGECPTRRLADDALTARTTKNGDA